MISLSEVQDIQKMVPKNKAVDDIEREEGEFLNCSEPKMEIHPDHLAKRKENFSKSDMEKKLGNQKEGG